LQNALWRFEDNLIRRAGFERGQDQPFVVARFGAQVVAEFVVDVPCDVVEQRQARTRPGAINLSRMARDGQSQ
jgi:hypothetical protein